MGEKKHPHPAPKRKKKRGFFKKGTSLSSPPPGGGGGEAPVGIEEPSTGHQQEKIEEDVSNGDYRVWTETVKGGERIFKVTE